MHRRALASLVVSGLVLSAAALSCKAKTDQGTIQILTVDDPFVGPPPATTITVQAIDLDGGVTTIASAQPIGQASVDLGTHDETSVDSIVVTAADSAGDIVAYGQTLDVELQAISGLSLGVFVQRTGALSRMPNPLSDAREAPLVGVISERYIFMAGGSNTAFATQTQIYDLLAWSPLSSPPSFTLVPASMVISGLEVLAMDTTGATWYDLSTGLAEAAATPSGTGTWADVLGGATVYAPDGSAYVVGATRSSGAPSSVVLVASATGTLSFAQLTTPRLGASAGWVQGVGLVIAGGSAATTSAGVEVIGGSTTTKGVPLAFPTDATAGAGIDALDTTHVLLVGGSGNAGTSARVLALGCTSMCTPQVWAEPLPTPLPLAQVFAIDAASAFVIGEDASGSMHAYRISPTVVQEVPFKVPRHHARGVRLPTGPVAVVGGDTTIESFVP